MGGGGGGRNNHCVCELQDVLWETRMKTIRGATSTRLYGFIASSGAPTAECVYIQGRSNLHETHSRDVCRSGSACQSFLHVSLALTYTHTPLSGPPPPPTSSPPPFFSLHQLRDTQQWAVTLEKKHRARGREGRRKGKGAGGRKGHNRERRYRKRGRQEGVI